MLYFLKRLPTAFLTVFLVATLCFLLTKAAGERAAFGEGRIEERVREQIAEQWGLNKPLHEQYWMHMSKLLVLDSMPSRKRKGQTLRDILGDFLPYSLRLGVRAMLLAIVFGVPIGVLCAVYHNRVIDQGGTVAALVGVSVPSFILASLAVYYLSRYYRLLPATSWAEPTEIIPLSANFKDNHWIIAGIILEIERLRLWIPAACLGAFPFAAVLRLTRSSMLETLRQDYIRTAMAKGVSRWKVIVRHGVRNGLTPVVTYVGPVTAGVLTGSLVVESIFAIPGLGREFVESVNNRDMPLIMGLTVFYSALLVGMNLVVDAIYPILNPRLKD